MEAGLPATAAGVAVAAAAAVVVVVVAAVFALLFAAGAEPLLKSLVWLRLRLTREALSAVCVCVCVSVCVRMGEAKCSGERQFN